MSRMRSAIAAGRDSARRTLGSRWLSLPLVALVLACCAAMPPAPRPADELRLVIVRHAEKASADDPDPELSAAGRQRAEALAQRLAGEQVLAIYSTDLRRTRQTVAPTAAMHGLAPRLYDPREPASAFAARLLDAHRGGTVLVAGHSNTVPAIVAALCSCEADAMSEAEYDRISTVRIGADGSARLDTDRY